MPQASKHLDIVLGIDIHLIQFSGPVPPLPVPNPFIGIIFDEEDYEIPFDPKGALMHFAMKAAMKQAAKVDAIKDAMKFKEDLEKDALGLVGMNPKGPATIKINLLPRTKAGTRGKAAIKHLSFGGTFVLPHLVINECEAYEGSSTVLVDKEPLAYSQLKVLSCSDIGMPAPPRKSKKPTDFGMFLTTSMVMAIPLGKPVKVGGTPIPSKSALIRNLVAGGLAMIRSTKWAKKKAEKMHQKASDMMDKRGWKSNGLARSLVHRGLCKLTGHPVDVATGKVLTDAIDFQLPGPIPLVWERVWYSTSTYSGPLGHGWHHNYDIALGFDPDDPSIVLLFMADGRIVFFPYLEEGESYFDEKDRLTLHLKEGQFYLEDENRLTYYFKGEVAKEKEIHVLERIENPLGHQLQFKYRSNGSLSEITDSVGRKLIVDNDKEGRISAIHAPHPEKLGKTFPIVQYCYNKDGDLISVKDAHEQPFSFEYENHLLLKETNRNGLSFHFDYDGIDHEASCKRTWGDHGIYDHKLTYFPEEKKTIVENSLGEKETHFYNDLGLVYKTIDAYGHSSKKKFGPNTELLSEINEIGEATNYTYNPQGKKIGIITADGAATQMVYDEKGQLISAIDSVGGEWEWSYDERGKLLNRKDAIGRTTQYNYNAKHQLKTIITPDGGSTKLVFGKSANLVAIITPDDQKNEWDYDNLGRMTRFTDPNGNVQQLRYDLLGRVVEVNEPDGNKRVLKYDRESNLKRAIDKHHDIQFEYKGMNRMSARIEAGTRVEFEYDTEEQLIAIRNEHGSVYSFDLNKKGQVEIESGFDEVKRFYKRDAVGQVISVTRAFGIETHYEYDSVGRVMEVTHSTGEKESFAYRSDGALIEAINDDFQVRFERDVLGRITKEYQGNHWIASNYTGSGLRENLFSSFGADVFYGRNIMGDVERMTLDGLGKPWEATFKRDNLGLEIERNLPGGVQSRWERDRIGRPKKQEVWAGGRPQKVREYVWGVNDRLKKLIDAQQGTTTFEHDVFGNLAGAIYPNGQEELRMPDAIGNLFHTRTRSDRKYGAAGQLLEANGAGYNYDEEGNLIFKRENNGAVWHYEWNGAGMLKKVIRPDGNTVTFRYDAMGRRIAKTYLGKTTRWIWDGNVPLHEWIVAAEDFIPPKRLNLSFWEEQDQFFNKKPNDFVENKDYTQPANLITWIFEAESFAPLTKVVNNNYFGIISDHLGTPITMLDEQGQQVWGAETSIYGQLKNVFGDVNDCPFRYPGQYEDRETGLYYNRFRYYDADGGIYINQDPIGLKGGGKVYEYVYDVNRIVDPLGLQSCQYRTEIERGTGRANKQGTPNSIYEQIGSDGKVTSRTFYDENGHRIARQDFDHSHGGIQPHEHQMEFHKDGNPKAKKTFRKVPSGYDTEPTPND